MPTYNNISRLLISELPGRVAGKTLPIHPWIGVIAGLTVLAFSLVVVFLSHLAGADTRVMSFASAIKLDSGEAVAGPSLDYFFGYIPELNHALLYITVAPLFVALAVHFLLTAGGAVELLADQRRLRISDKRGVAKKTEAINRQIFIWCAPGLAIFCLGVAGRSQYENCRSARVGTWPFSLGLTEAPWADRWASSFNGATATEKWDAFASFRALPGPLAEFVARRVRYRPEAPQLWSGLLLDRDSGQALDATKDVDAMREGHFVVDLKGGLERGLLRLYATAPAIEHSGWSSVWV